MSPSNYSSLVEKDENQDITYASMVLMNFRSARRWAQEKARNQTEEKCKEPITDNVYLWLLIPDFIFIGLLALMRIKQFKKKFCQRFNLPREPVNVFGLKDRFSYAATFGAITFLCFEIAVKQRYVIDFGNTRSSQQVLAIVVSIVVYSINYFPLLGALAEKNIIGDTIGTLYITCLSTLYLVQKIGCYGIRGKKLILFLQNIPIFMCLIFLSVSFPARLIVSVRKHTKLHHNSVSDKANAEYDDIKKSPNGRHVSKLLSTKQTIKKDSIEKGDGLLDTVKGLPPMLADRFFYRSIQEFRYSVRMVSVVIVALILIYMITIELLVLVIPILRDIKYKVGKKLNYIRTLSNASEAISYADLSINHKVIVITSDVAIAVEGCVLTSVVIAGILGLINIIHTLTSYRTYLKELNRGINRHISDRNQSQNINLLVGSMRFAGYQIGFTIFAYAVHLLLLFGFTLSISLSILVVQYGNSNLFFRIVGMIWPTVLFSILIDLIQTLSSKFIFLQRKGEILAIRYRRAYLIFLYFTFIFNIVIGMVRCQYRIFKTLLLGMLTLSRLDHSSLSRRFELYDTGFKSYVGFLHLENVNSHPVLTVFMQLVRIYSNFPSTCEHDHVIIHQEHVVELGSAFLRDEKSLKRSRARTRWFLLYTLLNNPQLQFTRRQNPSWLED